MTNRSETRGFEDTQFRVLQCPTTDVASERVSYFVVTRDRPNLLRKCLLSLAAGHESGLGHLDGSIYVVDDSTSHRCRSQVSSICRRRHSLPVFYLGPASYAALLDGIQDRTGLRGDNLRTLVGPLGSAGWNVHAARNFAWLFARVHLSEVPLYCFLDDDIQLTLETYFDRRFRPDALRIIADNLGLLRSSLPVALGSSFLGRQDVTLSRHIEIASRRLLRSNGSRRRILRNGFPLSVAARRCEIDSFDDIPSTGFLVTNSAAIESAHLCGFYNEDWLWARLLTSESHAKIARLKPAALHIGPAQACTPATMLFQEMGEILYDALTDSLLQKPKDEAASRFAREHLDQVAMKSAVDYHLGVLARRLRTTSKAATTLDHSRDKHAARSQKSLKTCITGMEETIRRLNDGEYRKYLAPFHTYLDQIPVWRRLVPR